MQEVKNILKNYDNLLKEVRDHVAKTESILALMLTRQKAEMAWNIGKSIEGYLQENIEAEGSSYGGGLVEKLEADVGIAQSVLYQMRKFYITYPNPPESNSKLSWSHYSLLANVKRDKDRKYLENLIVNEGISVADLRKRVKKVKGIMRDDNLPTRPKPNFPPRRGNLFCYKLMTPVGSDKLHIDCGFKIYRQVEKTLLQGVEQDVKNQDVKIIEARKSANGYSFKKSDVTPRHVYTYKAHLKRVVDGDTIRAMIDLGFGILHEETLRLRGINAAEAKNEGGKKATQGLEKILKDSPTFIVRTSSTDMYNRYLADIFLVDEKTKDLQEAADSGIYLNQLLLNQGLAELY